MLSVEFLITVLLLATESWSFVHHNAFSRTITQMRGSIENQTPSTARRISFNLRMSTVTDETTTTSTSTTPKVWKKKDIDYSGYAIGQKYEAKVVSTKTFGLFVELVPGVQALVPRSKMSQKQFDSLKEKIEKKEESVVKVELIGVSAENQTISARLVSDGTDSNKGNTRDLTAIIAAEPVGKTYTAEIVNKLDFGVFARIKEFGVDGLIPRSSIPRSMSFGNIKIGSEVQVVVEEINAEKKKVVLAFASTVASGDADVSGFVDYPNDQWMMATVTGVTGFGLFVRPAGSDVQGLVYRARIPRELIDTLLSRLPEETLNTEDVGGEMELLFQPGDVVKARVHSVNTTANRLEMSMVPVGFDEAEDNVYVSKSDMIKQLKELRALELEEDNRGKPVKVFVEKEIDPLREPMMDDEYGNGRNGGGRGGYEEEEFDLNLDDDEEKTEFDPESVLLWWRGAKYTPAGYDDTAIEDSDEFIFKLNVMGDISTSTIDEIRADESRDADFNFVLERGDLVEGIWRRAFEEDLQQDENDYESKAVDLDIAEINEEIGDVDGIDSDMTVRDAAGFGTRPVMTLGNFVNAEKLPEEWRKQLSFYTEQAEMDEATDKKVKAGAKGDMEEFVAVLASIEANLPRDRKSRNEPDAAPVAEVEEAAAPEDEEEVEGEEGDEDDDEDDDEEEAEAPAADASA